MDLLVFWKLPTHRLSPVLGVKLFICTFIAYSQLAALSFEMIIYLTRFKFSLQPIDSNKSSFNASAIIIRKKPRENQSTAAACGCRIFYLQHAEAAARVLLLLPQEMQEVAPGSKKHAAAAVHRLAGACHQVSKQAYNNKKEGR